jgi:predicted DNA-binding antitoxin AbrB/MazE fold protein
MVQRIKAIYRNGAFYPEEDFDFPEDTHTEILIETPNIIPPKTKDLEERKKILEDVLQSMQKYPISTNQPKMTRDMLHERG